MGPNVKYESKFQIRSKTSKTPIKTRDILGPESHSDTAKSSFSRSICYDLFLKPLYHANFEFRASFKKSQRTSNFASQTSNFLSCLGNFSRYWEKMLHCARYRSLRSAINREINSTADTEVRHNNSEESILYYIRKYHNDLALLHWFCRTSRSAHERAC